MNRLPPEAENTICDWAIKMTRGRPLERKHAFEGMTFCIDQGEPYASLAMRIFLMNVYRLMEPDIGKALDTLSPGWRKTRR